MADRFRYRTMRHAPWLAFRRWRMQLTHFRSVGTGVPNGNWLLTLGPIWVERIVEDGTNG